MARGKSNKIKCNFKYIQGFVFPLFLVAGAMLFHTKACFFGTIAAMYSDLFLRSGLSFYECPPGKIPGLS
jgi:hypothetical protein